MIQLRDYQMDLFNRIHSAFKRGVKGVCAVAPCGAGKTVLFSYLANRARLAGTPVMLLVHRKELLTQASATLRKLAVPHGIISSGITADPAQLVQVAMVGTLARRLHSVRPPGLIIADECHHLAAGSWKSIVKAFPKAYLLGVTATPLRLDSRGLSDFFSELILGPTVSELTDMGFLTPAKYFCPPVGADFKGMKKTMGDFAKSDAAERMDKAVIRGRACEHYLKICPGVPAICFCVTVTHAEHTAESFTAAGVPAKVIHGGQSPEERKRILADLASGKILVVTSCELASEGLDIPGISAAIFLRPTNSLGLYTQQAGRAIRLYPGKSTAYILDCVGNVSRHGLLTDPREWSLEGHDKKKSASVSLGLKQCSKCFCLHKPAPECPECGHVHPVPKARKLSVIEGNLEEFTRGPLKAALSECKSRDDLKILAKAKGFKPGWIYYMAKEMNL